MSAQDNVAGQITSISSVQGDLSHDSAPAAVAYSQARIPVDVRKLIHLVGAAGSSGLLSHYFETVMPGHESHDATVPLASPRGSG